MTHQTLAQLQAKYAELEAIFKREREALDKQMAEVKKAGQANAVARIRSSTDMRNRQSNSRQR